MTPPSDRMGTLRTVCVEIATAAALDAEALRSGRSVSDVYREYLGRPTGPLLVKVVNLDAALQTLIRAQPVGHPVPWPDLVREAMEAEVARHDAENAPEL